MEFTVADGKFPNHIMTVGLCRAPNEIHYVAHRAWDSGGAGGKKKCFPRWALEVIKQPPTAPHTESEDLKQGSVNSHSGPNNQLEEDQFERELNTQ